MKLGLFVAAASLLTVTAFAAVESGLKPGARVSPFQVVDVTGPNKGKELCYRCQYGPSPVVAAFINGEPTKAAKLLTDLQKVVDSHKNTNLKSFVVFMAGPETKDAIQKIASANKITIPLTFLPKGAKEADIESYKINANAKNTVMLWKTGAVANTFVDVDTAKVPEITKAVDAMLK